MFIKYLVFNQSIADEDNIKFVKGVKYKIKSEDETLYYLGNYNGIEYAVNKEDEGKTYKIFKGVVDN